MIEKRLSFSNSHDRIFIITGLAIIAALILTLVSLSELCSEECAEGHNYLIFGMNFEIFGLVFFGLLGVIHLLSRKFEFLTYLVGILFASALGAELMFIIIQKYVIGKWCPLCLGIVACVALGVGSMMLGKKEETMKSLQRGLISTAAICIGFMVAFLGITKYDAMEAAQDSIKESLAFGNKDSNIEVYLFTDWACSACRKLEPSLEEMAQNIVKDAKLIFVDHVVHPETLNFIPYHLAFMLRNKPHYFKLRRMLTEISKETGAPDEDEIAAASAKIGVKFEELNYSDIALGIKYFKKLGEKFKIKGTPTMVIINREAKKGKKLSGNAEITNKNVRNAIEILKSYDDL